MNIYKLKDDGSTLPVLFNVSEREIDDALNALPKGRYFYFDDANTRIFSEKLQDTDVQYVD